MTADSKDSSVLRRVLSNRPTAEEQKRAAEKRKADAKREAEDRKILTDIRWELQEQRKYLEVFRHVVAHDVLAEVHASATDPLTDDAGLVEKAGIPVTCVPGSELALKITRPLDLVLAEALLRIP